MTIIHSVLVTYGGPNVEPDQVQRWESAWLTSFTQEHLKLYSLCPFTYFRYELYDETAEGSPVYMSCFVAADSLLASPPIGLQSFFKGFMLEAAQICFARLPVYEAIGTTIAVLWDRVTFEKGSRDNEAFLAAIGLVDSTYKRRLDLLATLLDDHKISFLAMIKPMKAMLTCFVEDCPEKVKATWYTPLEVEFDALTFDHRDN